MKARCGGRRDCTQSNYGVSSHRTELKRGRSVWRKQGYRSGAFDVYTLFSFKQKSFSIAASAVACRQQFSQAMPEIWYHSDYVAHRGSMCVPFFSPPPVVDSIGGSAAIQAANFQPHPAHDETWRQRKTNAPAAKVPPPHLLAVEQQRLKSKRQALERQRLLRARTGSLHDFIPNPASSARSASKPTPQQRSRNPKLRWQPCQGEKERAAGLADDKSDAGGGRRGSQGSGSGALVSKAAPAGKVGKEGLATTTRPSRLQDTLHR